MLELKDVGLTFRRDTPDESVLFDRFNLTVQEGEFVCIIGSNGSGKTTLLDLVCGSVLPDSGEIYFCGDSLKKQSESRRAISIGRVFQDPKAGTASSLTILENMALADNKGKRYALGAAINKHRIERYQALLKTCGMGLENRLNTKVGTLSGGQRQALALLIANMSDIRLLLLDEHTAALDPRSCDTIMQLTEHLVQEKKVTTLMVTHNLRYALSCGNRLIMMDEGKVIMDLSAQQKQEVGMEEILRTFHAISLEKGN